MDFLINTIFKIFYPFVLIFLKKYNYSDDSIMRKKGIFNKPDFENKKIIMFHGVSVGEINAIEKLIKKTREVFPEIKIVVTTGTNTGQEIAAKKLENIVDYITYFPFDTPFCIENFFARIKPTAIFMAETEIWPFFVNKCYQKRVPLFIINGRISDRTFNSYKKFKIFFKNLLKKYTGIYTQSSEDLNKFLQLGANQNTTERMNNLKFDITPPDVDISINKVGRILLAASTHTGEDEIILKTYQQLKKTHKDLKLLIAPRHLQRVNEIENLIKNSKYSLKSQNCDFNENDIIVLDTMGELGKLFSFADISFIGGSFNKTGGHNPLESIIFNKPVISGPSINNFKDIYAIIKNAKAGFVVKSQQEFFDIANKLLSNINFYNNTVNACQQVFKAQQGALDFVINKIKTILENND